MPTTSLAGDRSRRARNPKDVTGTRYAQQHAELKAKEDAENIDVAAIRHAAYTSGHAAGYEAGFTAGWDSLALHLVEEGILDPDEPGEGDE
jgi:hypothetical protein